MWGVGGGERLFSIVFFFLVVFFVYFLGGRGGVERGEYSLINVD